MAKPDRSERKPHVKQENRRERRRRRARERAAYNIELTPALRAAARAAHLEDYTRAHGRDVQIMTEAQLLAAAGAKS